MRTLVKIRRAWEKIIVALSEFDYLTTDQLTRLRYSPSSRTHVEEQLKALMDASLVTAVAGKAVNLPRIYTLSGMGRQYASVLGAPKTQRFRPSEEQEKGHNPYLLKHTMAVTDVLLAGRPLSQTHPAITLSRMVTERELKRKIYVALPERICIKPDASCEFAITEMHHNSQRTWRDFFHIEVYRNLPPVAQRFKQKIQGYVTYALTGQHKALFQTPALSIAVIAATDTQHAALKRWTEEALQEME
jgi:DNA-binding HxlR family transcriptional regulator